MFMALKNCHDIHQYFKRRLSKRQFCVDRNGHQTIELLGACFEADRPAIIGTPNQEYIDKEIAWYDSQSLDIYDMGDPPAQWINTADHRGKINSNYGYLLYNERNGNQYDNVIKELTLNPDSRRACAIYTRPSIWKDYNKGGMNDFICTNAVSYTLRDNQLHVTVQMRSNDAVYGYKNDRAWQLEVQKRMCADLGCDAGRVIWQVQNLHVYGRHFHLV